MSFFVDLVLILLILLFALNGRKNGFIKTVFSFIGGIVSCVLAAMLARPVGSFLGQNLFLPPLQEKLSPVICEQYESVTQYLNYSALPETLKSILSFVGIHEKEVQDLVSQHANQEGAAEATASAMLQPVATGVGIAVAFLILFIVIFLLVRFLVKLLDLISRLPVLNFSNKLLGLAAGAVLGLFFAVILSGVLNLLTPAFRNSESALLQGLDVEKTYLARFLVHLDLIRIFHF